MSARSVNHRNRQWRWHRHEATTVGRKRALLHSERMAKLNQNPEQKARDNIDAMLAEAGWHVQDNKAVNFSAGLGIAVREYQTDIGPAY